MAVYKVIQDVEAEDKILGPLSLKQLIFAGISVAIIFVAFRLVTAVGSIFVAIPFLPFIFAFGVLAAPLGRDQPTELWLAAQIRFYTKPRIRIWDQSGLKELVHITVPKKEEKYYTDGLSQTQVHSRLKALANTLDSRGWAVKNVDINMSPQMAYGTVSSDRLIDPSTLPQAVIEADVHASDDIMDVNSNQTAQHFEQLMQQSSQEHKAEAIERMHNAAQQVSNQSAQSLLADNSQTTQTYDDDGATNTSTPDDYWFMHQPQSTGTPEAGQAMFEHTVITPGALDEDNQPVMHSEAEPSPEEQAIIDRAKVRNKEAAAQNPHHKVVLTQRQQEELAQQQKAKEQEQRKKEQEHKTRLTKTDTIELANANLKVSTIASLAHHKTEEKHDPNEVVVKLR